MKTSKLASPNETEYEVLVLLGLNYLAQYNSILVSSFSCDFHFSLLQNKEYISLCMPTTMSWFIHQLIDT